MTPSLEGRPTKVKEAPPYVVKDPRWLWYIYPIFEVAKFSLLFAFMADLVCWPELAFSKIENDNLLVCEVSNNSWSYCKSMISFKVILMLMIIRCPMFFYKWETLNKPLGKQVSISEHTTYVYIECTINIWCYYRKQLNVEGK